MIEEESNDFQTTMICDFAIYGFLYNDNKHTCTIGYIVLFDNTYNLSFCYQK